MNLIDTTNGIGELIHFYDNLPNYDDINHLTNNEFEAKLIDWKSKRKWFSDFLQQQQELENKIQTECIDYKRLISNKKKISEEIVSTDKQSFPIYDFSPTKKSLLRKEKRKAQLQAQIKPFSFTRRDEEIQELSKHLSLPCIYHEESSSDENLKQFKAKPIPRNLFSNYIYKKMHDDEFYRSLQKRVRSEEMLNKSVLPPSMFKREKLKFHYDICPRFYRDYENSYGSKQKHFKKAKSTSGSSSLSLLTPFNRDNLAAVLRVESAKNRLETEAIKQIEEANIKRQSILKEKSLRKKPIWKILSSYSHKDDLAARLQMRRDEENIREKEHRNSMQKMLSRVNKQPTLLERQSQLFNNHLNDNDLIYNLKDLKL